MIDVGGDDAGAAALGRYSAMIREAGGCDVLYVVNAYRYLTRTSEEAAEILGEIERKARLEVTAVVNNSNLADITTADDIVSSAGYAEETARRYGIPVLCTTAWKKLAAGVGEKLPGREIYPVDIYVKKTVGSLEAPRRYRVKEVFSMAKMTVNRDICKGCGLCVEVCPKKIVFLDKSVLNGKGYHPATVTDMESCIGCAMCATMCPDCAITVEK